MSKKTFNNVEPDINHQNIVVKKRRKTKENYIKPSGTTVNHVHPFLKKSKKNVSKVHSKKRFSKSGNTFI